MTFAACLFFVTSLAFAAPSAKFTAYTTNLVFADDTSGSANLSLGIKTSNKADLLIGVSLQTGRYTQTRVKSQKGIVDLETAEGLITVEVEVYDKDGNLVEKKVFPDFVKFDYRYQELEAKLGGIILECEDTGVWTATWDPVAKVWICEQTSTEKDGKINGYCECSYLDEEINLILNTMGAHHFNFVAKDLEAGEYELRIIVTGTTTASSGDAEARVGVGPSSITVEQVRATNSPNGIEFDENP